MSHHTQIRSNMHYTWFWGFVLRGVDLTWELAFQSTIESNCSNLVVGFGGEYAMVLGRIDIKFITLSVREGGTWRGGHKPDTGIPNLMNTPVFLLHWSDSLP